MDTIVCYNTSPTATATVFGVRPLRRAERIQMMEPRADELAERLRAATDRNVSIVRIESDDAGPFGVRQLTPETKAVFLQWLAEYPWLANEANTTIRMMDDGSIATLARLTPYGISDADVAIAVAHEVLSVAHEIAPDMLLFCEFVEVIEPAGPYDPETTGFLCADENGVVDESAWWGHLIVLPIDTINPAIIAHEVAHVMGQVHHRLVFGHDARWVRCYSTLLAEIELRGTLDVIGRIVEGHECPSSVAGRAMDAIPIIARERILGTASYEDRGLPPFEVLQVLVESCPAELETPIHCPYAGVMTIE